MTSRARSRSTSPAWPCFKPGVQVNKFFTFFSQSNLSDYFVNFVDSVIVDKPHYEKWAAVESEKLEVEEQKKKKKNW